MQAESTFPLDDWVTLTVAGTALRRRRRLLSCDGRINGPSGATSARLDLRGACQVSRHRRAIGSGWRCRRFDWLLNKSYYLSDLSLDTVVTPHATVSSVSLRSLRVDV